MSMHADLSTRLNCLLILVLSFGSVGCGNSGKSGSDTGPAYTTALLASSWTLTAGEETYKCNGAVAARDLYITGFRAPTIPGLARMTVTVADTVDTLGDYDCSPAAGLNRSRLIYAAGPGVNDVVFPAGKGVVVHAGQYIHVNMHLANNDGTTGLSGTTQLLVATGTAAEVRTPVEMIYIGTFNIDVPPNSTGVAAMGGCSSPIDQKFLFLLPAMFQHATHQQVLVTPPTSVDPLKLLDIAYDFTKQTFYPMSPEFNVPRGAAIRTACIYDNPSPTTIRLGDSVKYSETCYTGVYRYPVIPDTTMFECTSG